MIRQALSHSHAAVHMSDLSNWSGQGSQKYALDKVTLANTYTVLY